MSIEIDPHKCVVCGACVGECPAYILQADDEAVSVIHPERCIACGHCVAVCPTDALQHAGLPGPCDLLDGSPLPAPASVLQLIRSRRSIRAYTDEPVSPEHLAALIEAARYAPTAHNRQPWRFTILRSREAVARAADDVVARMQDIVDWLSDASRREALAEIMSPEAFAALRRSAPLFRSIISAHHAGVDMLFRGAPALIVIHAPRSAPARGEDCCYAAANVMLMAHALGLGTCLVGFLAAPARLCPEIAACVDVASDDEIGAALALGHPRYRYRRVAPRREAPVAEG